MANGIGFRVYVVVVVRPVFFWLIGDKPKYEQDGTSKKLVPVCYANMISGIGELGNFRIYREIKIMKTYISLPSTLAISVLCGLLVGCGGGGGGSSNVTIPGCDGISTNEYGCISESEYSTRQQSIAYEYQADSEFSGHWPLDLINADEAFAHLRLKYGANVKPGAGVTVGFMDSGIDKTHPALNANLIEGKPREKQTSMSHGTAAAGVVAAVPDTKNLDNCCLYGIAYGANIKMLDVALSGRGLTVAAATYPPPD